MLHEQIIFVTVKTEQIPSGERAVAGRQFGDGMYRAKVHYGFMEEPNIPQCLEQAAGKCLASTADTTYFLAARPSSHVAPGDGEWREKLFALMSRNATTATAHVGIPPDRVVELGEQIEI